MKIAWLLVLFSIFLVYSIVMFLIRIPQSGNPGISNSMNESKCRAVLVSEKSSNINELLDNRLAISPVESWVECAWIYSGSPWSNNGICVDGYYFCVRFSPEDFDKLINSGFPVKWRISLREDEKVSDVEVRIPDRITFYLTTLPNTPLVFEMSEGSFITGPLESKIEAE